jgi:hypothetical protein
LQKNKHGLKTPEVNEWLHARSSITIHIRTPDKKRYREIINKKVPDGASTSIFDRYSIPQRHRHSDLSSPTLKNCHFPSLKAPILLLLIYFLSPSGD